MALVMQARGNQGNFRRTVFETTKDDKGKETRKAVKTLTFAPGEPQELTGAELEAVKDDLGKALMLVELDEKGRPRPAKSASEGDSVRHAFRTTNSGTPEHAEAVQRLADEGPIGTPTKDQPAKGDDKSGTAAKKGR